MWRASKSPTCAHKTVAATSDNRATFAASYRIVQKSLAAAPRQSHRITEGDKDTRMHCRVCPARGWRRKAVKERITLDNEQEQQQTTDTCSPFSGSPSHHLRYTFRALFYSQPQIQYRGPRPKPHWYMHWIILI